MIFLIKKEVEQSIIEAGNLDWANEVALEEAALAAREAQKEAEKAAERAKELREHAEKILSSLGPQKGPKTL